MTEDERREQLESELYAIDREPPEARLDPVAILAWVATIILLAAGPAIVALLWEAAW